MTAVSLCTAPGSASSRDLSLPLSSTQKDTEDTQQDTHTYNVSWYSMNWLWLFIISSVVASNTCTKHSSLSVCLVPARDDRERAVRGRDPVLGRGEELGRLVDPVHCVGGGMARS